MGPAGCHAAQQADLIPGDSEHLDADLLAAKA